MTIRIDENLGFILPFQSDQATLPRVGGKGANLARLAQAGMPVPPGFMVDTQAYRAFTAANQLDEQIAAILSGEIPSDQAQLEDLSAKIRALFAGGAVPADLTAALRSAYASLGAPPVAVRSSATAEDLPDMSFAGQQDTYLNVVGSQAVEQAVVRCWASLWTARAIGYRARNGIPQDGVSLAVVVQTMVESQASGVMFTANPLSGLRSETVIDATFGLGEALVSGQVEPDHYVVDVSSGQIKAKTLGAKAISIRGQAGGGTAVIQEDSRDRQALEDAQILALANLGRRVADLYQFPQDIEWAWADGQLYLLQSRPITSLYPIPPSIPADDLRVFMSFAAVQGMLDPLTPLGRDIMSQIVVAVRRLFGMHGSPSDQTVFKTAGERIWIDITAAVRNRVGRSVISYALPMVEPGASQSLKLIWDDPRLQPGKTRLSFRAATQIGRFLLPMAGNILLNIISPERRRRTIVARGEWTIERMREGCAAIHGDRHERLAQLAAVFPALVKEHLGKTFLIFVSGVASGMATLNNLRVVSRHAIPSGKLSTGQSVNDLVLEISRAVPNNPTTDMDLSLWRVAMTIRGDPSSQELFTHLPVPDLVEKFRAGSLPLAAQQALSQFLDRYGGRGLGEIDAGRPRWNDDPGHIIEVITGYLQIADPDQAPDAVYARSMQRAAAAVDQLAAAVRETRGGWIKEKQVRFFANRARALLGLRESPKFFIVRMFAVFRQALLAVGSEYVQAGELNAADDLVYLSLAELDEFARSSIEPEALEAWHERIRQRRETYQRELRRRQIPRLLLSDGRAFYAGIQSAAGSENVLSGSPVSPGSVEGRVRVVFDPRKSGLQPGEILVCPGTDPSWTPLFLTAAGLVMEVGGMMTHGAVVAREYGIPAIVGVDRATSRLQTGQRIRINGSTGEIVIVEDQ